MLSQDVLDAGFQLLTPDLPQVVFHPVFGTIEFSKLTVERANNLFEAGYSLLTKVPTPSEILPLTEGGAEWTESKPHTAHRKTQK